MIRLLIIKLLRPPPLLRVLLRDVVEVLAAGDVEVVVVAGRLAVHRHRHVVALQPRQLEGLGISLAAGKIFSNSKKNTREATWRYEMPQYPGSDWTQAV